MFLGRSFEVLSKKLLVELIRRQKWKAFNSKVPLRRHQLWLSSSMTSIDILDVCTWEMRWTFCGSLNIISDNFLQIVLKLKLMTFEQLKKQLSIIKLSNKRNELMILIVLIITCLLSRRVGKKKARCLRVSIRMNKNFFLLFFTFHSTRKNWIFCEKKLGWNRLREVWDTLEYVQFEEKTAVMKKAWKIVFQKKNSRKFEILQHFSKIKLIKKLKNKVR